MQPRSKTRFFYSLLDRDGMAPQFAPDLTGRFALKTWQDEAVVYDLLSGDTHLLEPLALAVATHVGSGIRSREEVAERIAADFELPADESLGDLVDAAFSHLQRIGMIVSA